jgi:hypothetical protein
MKPFKEYHLVWLASHPHRTAAWLRERMADGFDIHHLDRNHENNEPTNLVLVEHTDHMRLHGVEVGRGRLSGSARRQKVDRPKKRLGRPPAPPPPDRFDMNRIAAFISAEFAK